jgi:hypothetical protein
MNGGWVKAILLGDSATQGGIIEITKSRDVTPLGMLYIKG